MARSGRGSTAQGLLGIVGNLRRDTPSAVLAILQNDPQQIHVVNEHGHSALHMAVKHDYVETMRALVGYGANVNLKDYAGFTPLMTAAYHGQEMCVRALCLEFHCSVNAMNEDGETALSMAEGNEREGIVDFLMNEYPLSIQNSATSWLILRTLAVLQPVLPESVIDNVYTLIVEDLQELSDEESEGGDDEDDDVDDDQEE